MDSVIAIRGTPPAATPSLPPPPPTGAPAPAARRNQDSVEISSASSAKLAAEKAASMESDRKAEAAKPSANPLKGLGV